MKIYLAFKVVLAEKKTNINAYGNHRHKEGYLHKISRICLFNNNNRE